MDGQYPPPIPPLGAFYPSAPPPMYPPEAFPPRLHQLQTMSMESLGGYSEYDDPNRTMLPPGQGQQRQRRRQPQGSEHVKHRRTRSGCYTCRQRRVKCDETHPICDRCRKGKRECSYPGTQSSSSSKPSRSSKSKGVEDSESSPSGDESDIDEQSALAAIPDDEEEDENDPLSGASDVRKASDACFPNHTKVDSPTLGASSSQRNPARPQPSRMSSKHSAKPSISQSSRWSTLPRDVKAYLKYHRDSLSNHHYAFKYDAGDFLKTTFLEIAINDDSAALLYAVVAFAAYHHTITRPDDDRISTFLSYYNKSITLLSQSLSKKRHNVATLLTILQLATIEEFLGDWTHLISHQRAAHQILTDLFNPQTIMQDETRRRIISWYIRFDLFAATMSGGQTALGREWFAACSDFYRRQAQARPDDLGARFEDYFANSRLLATDGALLFAAKTKGTMSDEQFVSEASSFMAQMDEFGQRLQTAFTDSSCFVKSFPRAPPPSDNDITDFRDTNFLYSGELFTMNYVLIDYWAIELMFKYQLMLAQQPQSLPELGMIALKKCKMFEAVEFYDQGPPGAVLGCQASLGLASLMLPKDQKHTDWARRKFALIEQHGYIYPAALRKRMSEQWGEDVTHWWLPNDEGYPTIIRAIRDFIEYRASNPTDPFGLQVTEMSGIFRSMNVAESPTIPDDLKGTGTDSDALDANMDPSISWESSSEQSWT